MKSLCVWLTNGKNLLKVDAYKTFSPLLILSTTFHIRKLVCAIYISGMLIQPKSYTWKRFSEMGNIYHMRSKLTSSNVVCHFETFFMNIVVHTKLWIIFVCLIFLFEVIGWCRRTFYCVLNLTFALLNISYELMDISWFIFISGLIYSNSFTLKSVTRNLIN